MYIDEIADAFCAGVEDAVRAIKRDTEPCPPPRVSPLAQDTEYELETMRIEGTLHSVDFLGVLCEAHGDDYDAEGLVQELSGSHNAKLPWMWEGPCCAYGRSVSERMADYYAGCER